MDQRNRPVSEPCAEPPRKNRWDDGQRSRITDKRVAQLLLVLRQLDQSLGALEELPKGELSDLVSSAIASCGFVDPLEARCAIATVLETIGVYMPES